MLILPLIYLFFTSASDRNRTAPAAKAGDEMVNQLMLPDADIDTIVDRLGDSVDAALAKLTGK